MPEVLYLSYSNLEDGLVFPNELETGIYAPGIWVIQAENKKNCPIELFFDAVDNNQVTKLITTRIETSNYQVDTIKYGRIYLRLIEVYSRYQNYVGNSKMIDKSLKFFQLVPIDILRITNLCLTKNFFLMGRIDEDINKG